MKTLSKFKEITNITIFVISLILLRIFMIIQNLHINYQIYEFSARFSFFVCTKSQRSRNLESIGPVIKKPSQKKYIYLQ